MYAVSHQNMMPQPSMPGMPPAPPSKGGPPHNMGMNAGMMNGNMPPPPPSMPGIPPTPSPSIGGGHTHPSMMPPPSMPGMPPAPSHHVGGGHGISNMIPPASSSSSSSFHVGSGNTNASMMPPHSMSGPPPVPSPNVGSHIHPNMMPSPPMPGMPSAPSSHVVNGHGNPNMMPSPASFQAGSGHSNSNMMPPPPMPGMPSASSSHAGTGHSNSNMMPPPPPASSHVVSGHGNSNTMPPQSSFQAGTGHSNSNMMPPPPMPGMQSAMPSHAGIGYNNSNMMPPPPMPGMSSASSHHVGGSGPSNPNMMPPPPMPGMPPAPSSHIDSHSRPNMMPPSSMHGMAPSSMHGMAPSSMHGMAPSSMPGMPPAPPGMPHMSVGGAMPQLSASSGMPANSYYPGQPGGPMAASAAAAQQQKRLDPNMMPSAVQVMDDDRRAHTGAFSTGYPRAELPPLVTTEFYCEDQGNCFPKFVRSTLYNGPVNNDLLKQCAIPFALSISPIARLHPRERPLPIVNLGDLGPVRCTRCKAYMCPFMEFKDGGRRFRCPFCKSTTEVPTEYFAHLDQNGQRTDIYERPELCLGSYEFVATKQYCKKDVFPKPPAFIFMLDVSYNAVRNGLVKLFCDNIKGLLQNLPKDYGLDRSCIDVGFATYDQSVHFYNLKSALGQPKMLIVNDVQDTFVPLVDGFLVSLQEAESVIDTLLSQIPQLFADTKVTELILGPAIQAGVDALKSSDRPGKLFIFHTSLPIYDAPGKLKSRDDRQLLGTEKEKTVLMPASEFYNKLAQECVGAGCCVDVFLFPNSYADVATIGCLCGMTGGQLFKYQYFQADIDGDRFLADLKRDIERPIVFDSIMRVRTSTGIRPTDFFGNFFMSNTTDVEMAALDCDKTITVEIKHDDKIEDSAVFVQVALLFTSVAGQRRLRIHNLSLNIGSDLASLYRSADLFTVVNYLAKQGERLLLQKTPREVRESMVNRCAQMLSTYRQHCSPGSSMGQLVLPETMKLLPLLVNCVIKHSAFTGGSDLSIDDRAWLMQILPSMSPLDTVYYFYPRILPVHEFVDEAEEYSTAVRCSYENLNSAGAYLFENGIVLLFWIGMSISPQWVQDVFGVQNFAQINAEKHDLPEKDNPTSRNLRRLVNKIQSEKGRCMKLYIVKQQDKLEPWFRKFMVEDKGSDSSPSYVEFLCHIHKEIRNLLS